MQDNLDNKPPRPVAPDLVRVLSTPETIEALGLSRRTWERLQAEGDSPVKTKLSEGRIGYRVCDLAAWLDARRDVVAS